MQHAHNPDPHSSPFDLNLALKVDTGSFDFPRKHPLSILFHPFPKYSNATFVASGSENRAVPPFMLHEVWLGLPASIYRHLRDQHFYISLPKFRKDGGFCLSLQLLHNILGDLENPKKRRVKKARPSWPPPSGGDPVISERCVVFLTTCRRKSPSSRRFGLRKMRKTWNS